MTIQVRKEGKVGIVRKRSLKIDKDNFNFLNLKIGLLLALILIISVIGLSVGASSFSVNSTNYSIDYGAVTSGSTSGATSMGYGFEGAVGSFGGEASSEDIILFLGSGIPSPSTEICNGVDDDLDGLTDEDHVCKGKVCYSDLDCNVDEDEYCSFDYDEFGSWCTYNVSSSDKSCAHRREFKLIVRTTSTLFRYNLSGALDKTIVIPSLVDLAISNNREYIGTVNGTGSDKDINIFTNSLDTSVSNFSISSDIDSIDIFNDARVVLASEADDKIYLYDKYGTKLGEITTNNPRVVRISPDQSMIAFASNNITIYDLSSGIIAEIKEHNQNLEDLEWSPDGNYLASASGAGEGLVKIFDVSNPSSPELFKIIHNNISRSDSINAIAWNPDGNKLIFTDTHNKRGRVFNKHDLLVSNLDAHASDILDVAWSPDGTWVASLDNTNLKIFNTDNYTDSSISGGGFREVEFLLETCQGADCYNYSQSNQTAWDTDIVSQIPDVNGSYTELGEFYCVDGYWGEDPFLDMEPYLEYNGATIEDASNVSGIAGFVVPRYTKFYDFDIDVKGIVNTEANFSDDFNYTEGNVSEIDNFTFTVLSGANWEIISETEHNVSLNATNKVLGYESNTDGVAVIVLDEDIYESTNLEDFEDMSVDLKFSKEDSGTPINASVLFKYKSLTTHYAVRIEDSEISLWKHTFSEVSKLEGASITSLQNSIGVMHNLSISMHGTNISVEYDGDQVISVDDYPYIKKGSVALRTDNSHFHFDDIEIKTYGPEGVVYNFDLGSDGFYGDEKVSESLVDYINLPSTFRSEFSTDSDTELLVHFSEIVDETYVVDYSGSANGGNGSKHGDFDISNESLDSGWLNTSEFGYYGDFDGSGDYLSFPGILRGEDNGSVELWVHVDDWSSTRPLVYQSGVFELYAYEAGSVKTLKTVIHSDSISPDPELVVSGVENDTFHVAVIWGFRGFEIYVDGELANRSVAAVTDVSDPGVTALILGGTGPSGTAWFDGQMDEFRASSVQRVVHDTINETIYYTLDEYMRGELYAEELTDLVVDCDCIGCSATNGSYGKYDGNCTITSSLSAGSEYENKSGMAAVSNLNIYDYNLLAFLDENKSGIYPEPLYSGNDITLNATCIERDNTTGSLTIYWNATNGSLMLSGSSAVVNGTETTIGTVGKGNTSSGEEWIFNVWCNDGRDDGPVVTYNKTVTNNPPSLEIIWPNATSTSGIFNVTWNASDVDGDVLELTECWADNTTNFVYNKTYDCNITNSNAAGVNWSYCDASEWESGYYYIWCNITDQKNTTLDYSGNLTVDNNPPYFISWDNSSWVDEDSNYVINASVTDSFSSVDRVWVVFNVTNSSNISQIDSYIFDLNVSIGSGNYTAHDTVEWKLYANDTFSGLNNSLEWQNFTVVNRIPLASSLISPSNGDRVIGTSVLLDWTRAQDLDDEDNSSLLRYNLEMSGSGCDETISPVDNTSFNCTSLNLGQTYYWNITADDTYDTNISDTWSFTVNTPPEVNVLITYNASFPDSDTFLICNATPSDDESDSVNVTFGWLKYNSTSDDYDMISLGVVHNATYNYSTLNCSEHGCVKGDILKCSVTPFDGYENGTIGSDSVVINNTNPTLEPGSLQILPVDPSTSSDLIPDYTYLDSKDLDPEGWTKIEWYLFATKNAEAYVIASEDFERSNYFDAAWDGNINPSGGKLVIDSEGENISREIDLVGTHSSAIDEFSDEIKVYVNGTTVSGERIDLFKYMNSAEDYVGPYLSIFGAGNELQCREKTTGDQNTQWQSTGINIPSNEWVTIRIVTLGSAYDIYYNNQSISVSGGDCVYVDSRSNFGDNLRRYIEGATFANASTLSVWIDDILTTHSDSAVVGSTYEISDGRIIIDSSRTTKGDTWELRVTPRDGQTFGNTYSTTREILDNALPPSPGIEINPEDPRTNDDLVCNISNISVDPDGDTIIYRYKWFKNGVEFNATNTTETTFNLDSSYTSKGETWNCTVTPYDGESTDGSVSASVLINNSLPVVSVELDPSSPGSTDDVECRVASASDADLDSINYTFRWYVNDISVLNTSIGNYSTLAGNYIEDDDNIECIVVPYDGEDYGAEVSETANVGNARAFVEGIPNISPGEPYTVDDLYPVYVYNDSDGDPESETKIEWYLNGERYAGVYVSINEDFDEQVYEVFNDNVWERSSGAVDVTNIRYNSSPNSLKLGSNNSYVYREFDGRIPSSDELLIYVDGTVSDTERIDIFKYEDASGDLVGPYVSVFGSGNRIRYRTDIDTWEDTGYELTANAWNKLRLYIDGANYDIYLNDQLIKNNAASYDSKSVSGAEKKIISGTELVTDVYIDDILLSHTDLISPDTIQSRIRINASETTVGDIWWYNITPGDGTAGISSLSSSVSIKNTIPSWIEDPSIIPDDPKTNDIITCVPGEYEDDDGVDTVTPVYSWYYSNHSLISAESTDNTLNLSVVGDKNDQIYCKSRLFDGFNYSSPSSSGWITIENTAPTQPIISLTPIEPTTQDNLTCTVVNVSTDEDSADSIQYRYRWYNGVDLIREVTKSNISDILASGNTSNDETWRCEVAAYDGDDYGDSDSAQLVIGSVLPELVGLPTIDLASPKTTDLLRPIYNYKDEDGQAESGTLIEWYKDELKYAEVYIEINEEFESESETGYNVFDIWNRTSVTLAVDSTEKHTGSYSLKIPNGSVEEYISKEFTALNANSYAADEVWIYVNGTTEVDDRINLFRYVNSAHQSAGPFVAIKGVNNSLMWRVSSTGTSQWKDTGYDIPSNTWTAIRIYIRGSSGSSAFDIYANNNLLVSTTNDMIDDRAFSGTMTKRIGVTGTSVDVYVDDLLLTSLEGATPATTQSFIGILPEDNKKGENWYYYVTLKDGQSFGTRTKSNIVQIQNTVPTVPEINLSDYATTADELSCSVIAESYDPDVLEGEDIVSYRYEWLIDGTPNASLETIKTELYDVLDSGVAHKNENWTCRVTPRDNQEEGLSVNDSLIISNSIPEISGNPAISPGSPNTTSMLNCTYIYNDADGADTEGATSFRWFLDSGSGFVDSGYTTQNISSSLTLDGQIWKCEVTPEDDEFVEGAAKNSTAVQIGSIAPSVIFDDDSTSGNPKSVGQQVTFTFNWTDADLAYGEFVSIYVCKTSEITASGCTGGTTNTYCSVINTNDTSTSCTYTTQTGDASVNDYWVRICDDSDVCSVAAEQDGDGFEVNHKPSLTTPEIGLVAGSEIYVTSTLQIANGNYSDQDSDAKQGSNYRWYKNDELILGETGTTLYLSSCCAEGDSIKVSEQPIDIHGLVGDWYDSAAVDIKNTPPEFLSYGVSPSFGASDEEFTFTAFYQDDDNTAPTIAKLELDSIEYDMTKGEGFNFVVGVPYRYYVTGLSEGTHAYRFRFSDGTTEISTGTQIGPHVENSAPEIWMEDPVGGETIKNDESYVIARVKDLDGSLDGGDVTFYYSEDAGSTWNAIGSISTNYEGSLIDGTAKYRVNWDKDSIGYGTQYMIRAVVQDNEFSDEAYSGIFTIKLKDLSTCDTDYKCYSGICSVDVINPENSACVSSCYSGGNSYSDGSSLPSGYTWNSSQTIVDEDSGIYYCRVNGYWAEDPFTSGEGYEEMIFESAGSKQGFEFEIPKDATIISARMFVDGGEYAGSYPTDLELDVGNDGSLEWTWGGSFDGASMIDIGPAITSLLPECNCLGCEPTPSPQNGCKIKMDVSSSSSGQLDAYSLNIEYSVLPVCSDGTLSGECSEDKPKYCDNGVLVNKCEGKDGKLHTADDCGCAGRDYCKVDPDDEDEYECVEVPNNAPIANAGDDFTTSWDRKIYLDGEASKDSDDDTLDYKWTQIDGPIDVTIENSTKAKAWFRTDTEGTYVFKITVDDDKDIDNDTISITVIPVTEKGYYYFGTLNSGASNRASFEYTPITEIEVTTNKQIKDVDFTIQRSEGVVSIDVDEEYAYVDIDTIVKVKDVKEAKIYFRVLNSWISDNFIEASTVTLYRYTEEDGWTALNTTIREDVDVEDYTYYVADTPGFSIFAIAADKIEGPVCGNNIREAGEACDGSDDSSCPGECLTDCVCPGECGNNIVETGEQCDGTEDSLCPGVCTENCGCLYICGNGVCESYAGENGAACPEDCGTSFVVWLIIILIVAGAGIGVYFFLVKGGLPGLHGLVGKIAGPKISKKDAAKLKKYIKNSRAQGYSDDEIKAALKIAGWEDRIISKYMKK